ncbi:hypothetical protein BKA66DRAFT_570507 [Pyrenochaeta sp. MPI-SDFR-AT-0127]|nr:hypothetical protein BKA66DRAFT_570507 [Pyrenochaeta sp. MPI-SDFR-AT-0127]
MPKVKRKAMAKSRPPAKSKSKPRTKANPTAKAKAAADRSAESEPVFFCDPITSSEEGFLSPWWRYRFEVKGVTYKKAGQYIMAEKARAFGDKKTLQKILEAETTEDLKSLGDNINGVEQKSWRRRASRIARNANVYKFTSDDTESRDLLRRLKNLGDRELVFADPSDATLGIGFSVAEAKEVDKVQWGANVFGKSLDTVRNLVKVTGKTANATKTRKRAQAASDHRPSDTSIFDQGGRLSVNW